MMSLEAIKSMSEEAAVQAAQNNLEPYTAFTDGDAGVFHCPFLGNHVPGGWKVIDTFFVDSSGFGSDNEPALSTKQFLSRVKGGLGYAVAEAGQFQVYIHVFKRVTD